MEHLFAASLQAAFTLHEDGWRKTQSVNGNNIMSVFSELSTESSMEARCDNCHGRHVASVHWHIIVSPLLYSYLILSFRGEK